MRALKIFLFLSLTTGSAASQANLPPPKPLNEIELRQVLDQLLELEWRRADVARLEAADKRDKEDDARERELNIQALGLKDERIGILQEKLDLALERAKLFEDLYKGIIKKPSIACRIFSVLFTLGIYDCK